ncbi:MAG: 50S ribosomal protein L18 [Deltaproteobacteria bacterium]|nr:50S ribosomal protein L18 [Deltaproteobacteria bacterium]
MGGKSRTEARLARKRRVRRRVRGTSERPRLSVFRSGKHIYAQIVDDTSARTLAQASSLSKDFAHRVEGKGGGNKAGAALVGEMVAKRALEKGIKKTVFDRNGFLYHGRIRALAEAAREHGLEF